MIITFIKFWGLFGNIIFTLLILVCLSVAIALGAENFNIVHFINLLIEDKCSDPFTIDQVFPYITNSLTDSNYVKIYIIIWSAILLILEGIFIWFEI